MLGGSTAPSSCEPVRATRRSRPRSRRLLERPVTYEATERRSALSSLLAAGEPEWRARPRVDRLGGRARGSRALAPPGCAARPGPRSPRGFLEAHRDSLSACGARRAGSRSRAADSPSLLLAWHAPLPIGARGRALAARPAGQRADGRERMDAAGHRLHRRTARPPCDGCWGHGPRSWRGGWPRTAAAQATRQATAERERAGRREAVTTGRAGRASSRATPVAQPLRARGRRAVRAARPSARGARPPSSRRRTGRRRSRAPRSAGGGP